MHSTGPVSGHVTAVVGSKSDRNCQAQQLLHFQATSASYIDPYRPFPCCDIPATLPSGGASALPVKESPELRRFQRWYHLAGIRLEVVISFCVWPCHVPATFVIRVGGRGLARNKLDLVVRVAGVAIGQQLQRKNISKHDVPMETLDAVCDTIKHHRKSQNDGWFPTCCAAMS